MGDVSCAVLWLGVVASIYHAYRGFMFQWIRQDEPFGTWSGPRKLFLLALADGWFYLITSASGTAALLICLELVSRIPDYANIAGGTAALLVFLAVYGVLGITGQLPSLIQLGKFGPTSFGGGG